MQNAHYPDLSSYGKRLETVLPEVRNIGWLDERHAFATGAAPAGLLEKLVEILDSKGVFCARTNRIRGVLPCPVCGEGRFEHRGVGSCELWLPATPASQILLPRYDALAGDFATGDAAGAGVAFGKLAPQSRYFATPSMLIHSIEDHAYLPPAQFVDAVMACDLDKPYDGQAIRDAFIIGPAMR
jgi:hypothetical protein